MKTFAFVDISFAKRLEFYLPITAFILLVFAASFYVNNPVSAFGPANFFLVFYVSYVSSKSGTKSFYGYCWSVSYLLIINLAIFADFASGMINLNVVEAFVLFCLTLYSSLFYMGIKKRESNFLGLPKQNFTAFRLLLQCSLSVLFFLLPIVTFCLLEGFHPIEINIEKLNRKSFFAYYLFGDFSSYFSYMVISSIWIWFFSAVLYVTYRNFNKYLKSKAAGRDYNDTR